MPSHKSCAKRMVTSEAARLRNRNTRSQMRKAIKELRAETNKEQATKTYQKVASLLDQAASRHVIHKKNADRNKSRLSHFVQKLA